MGSFLNSTTTSTPTFGFVLIHDKWVRVVDATSNLSNPTALDLTMSEPGI